MAIEGGLTGIDGLRGLEPGLGHPGPAKAGGVCAPRNAKPLRVGVPKGARVSGEVKWG